MTVEWTLDSDSRDRLDRVTCGQEKADLVTTVFHPDGNIQLILLIRGGKLLREVAFDTDGTVFEVLEYGEFRDSSGKKYAGRGRRYNPDGSFKCHSGLIMSEGKGTCSPVAEELTPASGGEGK